MLLTKFTILTSWTCICGILYVGIVVQPSPTSRASVQTATLNHEAVAPRAPALRPGLSRRPRVPHSRGVVRCLPVCVWRVSLSVSSGFLPVVPDVGIPSNACATLCGASSSADGKRFPERALPRKLLCDAGREAAADWASGVLLSGL